MSVGSDPTALTAWYQRWYSPSRRRGAQSQPPLYAPSTWMRSEVSGAVPTIVQVSPSVEVARARIQALVVGARPSTIICHTPASSTQACGLAHSVDQATALCASATPPYVQAIPSLLVA